MTIEDLMQTLASWKEENPIRKRRTAKGFSMSEVATLCGVSISAVQQWETGTYEPKADKWSKLEELLGGGLRDEWETWFATKPQI